MPSGRRSTIAASEPVGVSLGTAVVLELAQAPSPVPPTTAYLMLGGRCPRDCAFCAQACSSAAGEAYLSRVTWPPFSAERVIEALERRQAALQRVCIQATGAAGAFAATLALVRRLRQAVALPVDASVLPPSVAAARELLDAGVDHIGFGLDAATAAVFERVKGGSPERYAKLIDAVAATAPGRAAVHLIAGLGESERDMLEAVQRHHDMGVTVGLFAFTPVAGTRMQGAAPPPLESYRRLQAARHLIVHGLARAGDLAYGEGGVITGLGCAPLAPLLDGEAFRTSGCPGCNRPFYNERPAGPLYNYPRPLTSAEAALAIREMGLARAAVEATALG